MRGHSTLLILHVNVVLLKGTAIMYLFLFYNAKRYHTVRNVWLFSTHRLVENGRTELLGGYLTYAGFILMAGFVPLIATLG